MVTEHGGAQFPCSENVLHMHRASQGAASALAAVDSERNPKKLRLLSQRGVTVLNSHRALEVQLVKSHG